jgi:hypothetical protein
MQLIFQERVKIGEYTVKYASRSHNDYVVDESSCSIWIECKAYFSVELGVFYIKFWADEDVDFSEEIDFKESVEIFRGTLAQATRKAISLSDEYQETAKSLIPPSDTRSDQEVIADIERAHKVIPY